MSQAAEQGSRLVGKYPWYYHVPPGIWSLLLFVFGAAMIIHALFTSRPESVTIATMTSGVVLMLAGTVTARMRGSFRLSPGGIQGELADLDDFLQEGYVAVAPPEPLEREKEPVRHPQKRIQEILNAAEEQGWEVRRARHHFFITGPQGERATIPLSPRNPEWTVATLRKLGINIPSKNRRTSQPSADTP
jgi:hypothetical protein